MTYIGEATVVAAIGWSAWIIWNASRVKMKIEEHRVNQISLRASCVKTEDTIIEHCKRTDIHCNPTLEAEFREDVRTRLGRIEEHLLTIKRNGGSI